VEDHLAPSITCSNINVMTGAGTCSAVATYAPTVADNCAVASVTCNPASGSTFPRGVSTVTCTAADVLFNTASCSFTVTVTDNQGPSITSCPANIVVNNTPDRCDATVSYSTPMAVDACDGVRPVNCVPASGSTFNVGTTTVTCTSADASSNTSACSFTVTVNDVQLPQLSGCPANMNIQVPPGTVSQMVTFTAPTATDNCSGASVACVPSSGGTYPIGTTTVTCTATDAVSNTATCSFTVTIAAPSQCDCQSLAEIKVLVDQTTMNSSYKTVMKSYVDVAQLYLDLNRCANAKQSLQRIISRVQALKARGRIDPGSADCIINCVNGVIGTLGC
jgi:hypothetical protein